MGRPYAAYTRVSRVGDREDTLISPDLQLGRIRGYAEARGMELAELKPELDVSGGKVSRPILDEALEGVQQGRYAGIIVADIDRLSRLNLVDALKVIERVESVGGQVVAVAQNFDAATPEGRWGRNMWLATAHMQLERYGLQFRAAKRSAVERGIWPTNLAPYGYGVVRRKHGGDGKLHPNARREVVVRAFEARARGRSWRDVASILGVGSSAAAKIIRNPVYLGQVKLGEWVNPSAHEPLVDRTLWEAAQIEHPRPNRKGGASALLTGLVRCAQCGYSMTPSTNRDERSYRCSPHNKRGRSCPAPAIISQGKLDAYVERVVLREIERLTISATDRSDTLDRASHALRAAEAELEAFQRAVQVADVGEGAFVTGLRSRSQTVDEARRAVAESRTRAVVLPQPETLGSQWPELSVAERGHVLRSALAAVFVTKGSGPAEGRVRLIDGAFPIPTTGIGDLEGEIRVASAQDLE